MRRLLILLSSLALSAASLFVPSPASAAAGDFGHPCVASVANPDVTYIFMTGAPTNPVPATAPLTGVITKATFSMPGVPTPYPQKLKVLRGTGVAKEYTVIAESPPIPVGAGVNTYNTRVPAAAGDILGLSGGAVGTLACSTGNPADVLGAILGDSAPGTTATYDTSTGAAIPVVATVEPDADKDGYGDVTQDQCPQSASVQGECPIVKLDSFSLAKDGSILVLVGTSERAKVKVTGKAKVNGKSVKLGGKRKTVKPGRLGRYKVALPPALKAALAQLPRSRFIKVTITATATDVAGRKSKDTSSVKLYGTR